MKLDLINNEKLNKYINRNGIKPLVVLLTIGILLLVLSSKDSGEKSIIGSKQDENSLKEIGKNEFMNKNSKISEEYGDKLENSLKKMIKKINGVKDVEVMVTLKSSEEEVVLKDIPYEKEDTSDEKLYSENEETVMLEDEEGNTYPYIVKEINPKVEGVVVGVKMLNGSVEKDIIDIVQVLFDIPIHKIKIVSIK